MRKIRQQKKGLSPIIATVLLITMVIVIAAIIFLWAKSFIKEAVIKNGKNAQQSCTEVNLELTLSGTTLSAINRGNIPVVSLYIEGVSSDGQRTLEKFEQINLGVAKSLTEELSGSYGSVDVTPVLLGTVKKGRTPYICSNKISVGQNGA